MKHCNLLYLTFCFVLTGTGPARAQEDIDLDSLPGFMKYVNALKYSHPDSAIALFEIGLARSVALGSLRYERNSYAGMGITQGMRGNYASALDYFNKSLEVGRRAREPSWIAGSYSNKGIVYKYLGDYDKSLDEYFKALTIYDSIGDSSGMTSTYSNLGILYDVTGELERSLEYYEKSRDIGEKSRQNNLSLLSNMGILKMSMGNHEGALELLFAFLDSMIVQGRSTSIAATNQNIGTAYLGLGDLDKAEFHSRKALALTTDLKSPSGQAEACINLALVAKRRGRLSEALQWRQAQLRYAEQTSSTEKIAAARGDLSKAYRDVGQYERAYEHLVQHAALRDSLYSKEKTNAYEQWQTRLDVFSKDQEISAQELKMELLQAKVSAAARLRMALGIALVLALLSGFLFYQRARIRRKANQMLTEKNKKIETQKREIEIVNRELEKRMLRAQINPHFIFNSLNSIQHFITADEKLPALKYLSKFSKLLRQSLENSVSVNVPLAEEIQLLETYLELESLRFDQKFTYAIETDDDLDIHETEIPILLVQPFVENAVLHGFQIQEGRADKNRHLNIRFADGGQHIVCTIRDNGIGRAAAARLKNENIGNRPSRGLSVTEQRLALLYPEDANPNAIAIHDLTNADGQPCGTEVIVQIPK